VKINYNQDMICFLSEMGHKNFIYPTDTTAIILKDCKYEKLNYLSGTDKDLIAIRVKNDCLCPTKINTQSISIAKNGYSIVWITKNVDNNNTI
tara:strand:+ start:795 stop:1073 length:279 start_codon:yes stop_codon:yes gene_type:complete